MKHSQIFWLMSDIMTANKRGVIHTFRNIEALITAIVLPVVILLLFVIIFGGAIETGVAYVSYVVPSVILICAGYGSSTTAMLVSSDFAGGLFDRFKSLPLNRSSILIGHITGSLVRNAIATVLVFFVAFLIGFRPNATPLEWLGVIGLLTLLILSISWFSVIFGLLAKTPEAASGFSYSIMFLPYVSSAFVPTDTLPVWLRGFAEYQPFTPIIETLRGLLIGTPIAPYALSAILWCLGILAVSYIIAIRLFTVRTNG